MTENTVSGNMVASVHYKGTLPENGEVFDSSEGREPLTFLVGHKQMIPGFEEEIMGAKVGEPENSLFPQTEHMATETMMQ